MPMNPEIKQRWINALESGEYPQTTGVLKDENGFCCLGVLCEIAVEDNVVRWDEDFAHYSSLVSDNDSSDGELPESVADWAGLDSCNPESGALYKVDRFSVLVERDALMSELNDDMHLTFSQIAQIIKNNDSL
jgi:hypothetical protein